MCAQAVLNLPHALVDCAQIALEVFQPGVRGQQRRGHGHQSCELAHYIRALGRILDPLGLDLQDADLVDQFTHGDRRLDGIGRFHDVHRRVKQTMIR